MPDEILVEFIAESRELISLYEDAVLQLERAPEDASARQEAGRALHSLKGTAGFFELSRTSAMCHAGEDLLDATARGVVPLDGDRTDALLDVADVLREFVDSVESSGSEGSARHSGLVRRLSELAAAGGDLAAGGPIADLMQVSESLDLADWPADESDTKREGEGEIPGDGPGESDRVAPGGEGPPRVPDGRVGGESRAVGERSRSDVNAPSHAGGPVVASGQVRVDADRLDRVVDLVGELVLARGHLVAEAERAELPMVWDAVQAMSSTLSELQRLITRARMQPVEVVFGALPRVVRDMARGEGKRAELSVDGAATLLDRTIIEAVRQPLTHLVRNAVGHGIEEPSVRAARGKPPVGQITLRAWQAGGRAHIEIADDGGGIDAEKVRDRALDLGLTDEESASGLERDELLSLIFLPGFSTLRQAGMLAGRGVGLDVVRRNVERFGGAIELDSVLGEGTRIALHIPLSLAVIPGVVVRVGELLFVVPETGLREAVALYGPESAARRASLRVETMLPVRNCLIPALSLRSELGLGEDEPEEFGAALIADLDGRPIAMLVDQVVHTQDVVVKQLGPEIVELGLYRGATVLGEGEVALILDLHGIAAAAGATRPVAGGGAPPLLEMAVPDPEVERLEVRLEGDVRALLPLEEMVRAVPLPPEGVLETGRGLVVRVDDEVVPATVLGDGPLARVLVFERLAERVGVVVRDIEGIVRGRPMGAGVELVDGAPVPLMQVPFAGEES